MPEPDLGVEKEPESSAKEERSEDEQFERLSSELINMLYHHPIKIIPNESEDETKETKGPSIEQRIQWDLVPKDIVKYLDRMVIKQDEAKKSLAIAICDHLNHIRADRDGNSEFYQKQNVLMVGPSGVGKTYMIKKIADFIGLPFIKSDATKLSETGYQGADVDDLVRQLFAASDNNLEWAQYGIIYIDEIDKITGGTRPDGRDVGGKGVQQTMLKLMEETEVPSQVNWDMQNQIKQMMGKQLEENQAINTKHILFIVSGAFTGLEEICKSRLSGSKYGFERGEKGLPEDIVSQSNTEDFRKFGLEQEFIGRLPIRVFCHELSVDDLFELLKHGEESILKQYVQSFEHYGISMEFTDGALRAIAKKAAEEKTGARGLGSVLESIFRDYKYECPDSGLKHIKVDKALVNAPKATLEALLASHA